MASPHPQPLVVFQPPKLRVLSIISMENRSFLGHSRQFVIGRSLPNALSQEDKICVFLFASISNITTTKESNRFVKKDGITTPTSIPSSPPRPPPPPPKLSPLSR